MAPPICGSCGGLLGPGSYVAGSEMLCAACASKPWSLRAALLGAAAALAAGALNVLLAGSNPGAALGFLVTGPLVGAAVRKGARGQPAQILAVALTLAAIVAAFVGREELRRNLKTYVLAAAGASVTAAWSLARAIPRRGPFDPGPLDPPEGAGV